MDGLKQKIYTVPLKYLVDFAVILPYKFKPMDEKEWREFSWSGLFIVTACCSFLFNLIIKLMDGNFSNLLLGVGIFATFLGVANWGVSMLSRQSCKKRKNRRFVS